MFRIITVLIVLVLLFPLWSLGEEEVLIAVASEGKTLKDSVSQVAGRCPYFIFIDSTGKILEAVDNPFKTEGGSAGVSAANFLAEKKVTIIVAEKFGSKMKNVLQTKEITCFEWEGIVEEAVKKVLEIGDRI